MFRELKFASNLKRAFSSLICDRLTTDRFSYRSVSHPSVSYRPVCRDLRLAASLASVADRSREFPASAAEHFAAPAQVLLALAAVLQPAALAPQEWGSGPDGLTCCHDRHCCSGCRYYFARAAVRCDPDRVALAAHCRYSDFCFPVVRPVPRFRLEAPLAARC